MQTNQILARESFMDVPTEDSIRAAQMAQAEERARAIEECEGKIRFREDGRIELAEPELIDEIRRLAANVHPFPSRLEILDEQTTFSGGIEKAHILQLGETKKVEGIAKDLAPDLCEDQWPDLDRRQQAMVRRLATHVLRSSQVGWEKAATDTAIDAAKRAITTECGAAFRSLPADHVEALARLLVARVLPAYLGITEGTLPLSPGQYLRMTGGVR